jgi:hypothetical protein
MNEIKRPLNKKLFAVLCLAVLACGMVISASSVPSARAIPEGTIEAWMTNDAADGTVSAGGQVISGKFECEYSCLVRNWQVRVIRAVCCCVGVIMVLIRVGLSMLQTFIIGVGIIMKLLIG